MQIMRVPSVFSAKLPGGEWVNLALIRRLQLKSDPFAVAVTWANGDSQEYRGDKAVALLEAWEEAKCIDKSLCDEDEACAIDAALKAWGASEELVFAVKSKNWKSVPGHLLLVKTTE